MFSKDLEADVGKFALACREIHDEVVSVHSAMGHTFGMQVRKSVQRLADACGDEVLGERPVLTHDVCERTPVDKLRDRVEPLILHADSVVVHHA